jgi:hypothetical protein
MRDLHLLRALKEGGHKWNPSMKRDCRGATLEGNMLLASRAAREDQDDFTVLQNVDWSLDRTWRRVRAVNRNGTAVLQDPSR